MKKITMGAEANPMLGGSAAESVVAPAMVSEAIGGFRPWVASLSSSFKFSYN